MEEAKEKNGKLNLFAVLLAFIIGLTIGQIDIREVFGSESDLKSRETNSSLIIESTAVNTTAYVSTADLTESVTVGLTASAVAGNTEAGEAVYRTPTGKRYHYDPYCAGTNRIESTVDESTALGLTPCKKCAGG